MSTTIQKITYDVVITKDKEIGGYVGACDKLHAYSEGDTFGEIMQNMKEAIDLAIEDNPTEFNILIIQK